LVYEVIKARKTPKWQFSMTNSIGDMRSSHFEVKTDIKDMIKCLLTSFLEFIEKKSLPLP